MNSFEFQVKLKCLDGNTAQGTISLYLQEPRVCQYVLVVETKVICQLLTKVDENGLYEPQEEIGFSKASYKNGYQSNQKVEVDEPILKKEKKLKLVENNQRLPDVINDDVELDNHIPDGDD